jgi:hypothetical protein
MHYCPEHAALLPEGVLPLPMPDTRLQLLWLLAALNTHLATRVQGGQMRPVVHGPLAPEQLPAN